MEAIFHQKKANTRLQAFMTAILYQIVVINLLASETVRAQP